MATPVLNMPKQYSKILHKLCLVVIVAPLFILPTTIAQTPTNGSFENGLTSWVQAGSSGSESLTAAAFNNQITATDGNSFAFISSGPGNTGGPSADIDANGITDNDISLLSGILNFDTLPAVIKFDWSFASSEEDQPAAFDDIFDVLIDGNRILSGSSFKNFNGNSPFANVPRGIPPALTVNSAGSTNNSSLRFGIPNWTSSCITIPNAVLNTDMNLQFRVADQSDRTFDSGLLLDNIRVEPFCQPAGIISYIQITDTLPSQVEGKDGAFIFRNSNNIKPTVSDDGNILAFVANGDFATGNPFLYEQVFIYSGSTFSRVSAFTGDEIHSLEISANGDWLVFSARNNPTDNLEIFQYDRLNNSLVQITNSSSCDNRLPSINNNGGRIAFISDCQGDISIGFNPDASQEVVIWNNGSFITNDMSGCTNYYPKISLQNTGRYTAFASDCNYVAQNNDNSIEVYRYDRNNDTFIQITNAVAGEVFDSVDISSNGRYIHYIATDASGNKVVFRYDNNTATSTFVGLSRSSVIPLSVNSINNNNAEDIVVESLDLVTFEMIIDYIDVAGGAVTEIMRSSVTTGADVARIGGVAHVFYSNNADNLGSNNDVNNEIFRARID